LAIKGRGTAGCSTLALAQAGEFGFVLIDFSLQTKPVLGPTLGAEFIADCSLSMMITPAVVHCL